MSYRGEARFHCERTDEDRHWNPRKPEGDDYPEPDYFEEAVKRARRQAEAVSDPAKRKELLDALYVAERLADACLDEAEREKGGVRLFGTLPE